MYRIRAEFSKFGGAAYISHLDLMKTFQRSLRRAHLPVKYSQGFNPHIYISILAPLSTGYQCKRDVADFDLNEAVDYEEICGRLNAAFPHGIAVSRAFEAVRPAREIAFSRYEIMYPGRDAEKLAEAFKEPVFVEKRSKRSVKEVNLLNYIHSIAFDAREDGVLCTAVVSAGGEPLNPMYITAALKEKGLVPADFSPIYTRDGLLDKNLRFF